MELLLSMNGATLFHCGDSIKDSANLRDEENSVGGGPNSFNFEVYAVNEVGTNGDDVVLLVIIH